MGTVLVTGGRGFLGSHLVSRLLDRGEQVRVLARSASDNGAANGHTAAGLRQMDDIVYGDIRDAAAVDRAVAGTDVVVHLVSNFRRAATDREARAINVTGTEHVLRACVRHGVQQLIHCSTIGVHGSVREVPADEDTPFNPGDAYQRTKLEAEQRVREFARDTGLPVTILRPISLFGPGDERMLKLFRMIKQGRFVMVGRGEALFQPAYIDDVVEGFLRCLRNPRAIGGVFIIGGEEYLPLTRLVEIIAEELGVPAPRRRLPLGPMRWLAAACEGLCGPFGVEPPLHRRRLSFFENNRAFRVDRAKTMLGYQPSVSLRDGIRRTIAWYETHGWL